VAAKNLFKTIEPRSSNPFGQSEIGVGNAKQNRRAKQPVDTTKASPWGQEIGTNISAIETRSCVF
jgi:hypothetical protein